ncbi:MAG TPA: tRNA pseudouridine(55) synthase TruB [Gemmatimonadaceae bacterium]|nr:tRNA pseudouridine(55) synthase TruB [Gemmatimonadaceae bacterium]
MLQRRTSLPGDALLLVDKPAGVTSHDVVSAARRALRERRIGHLGTLDPFATGLLVLLVGSATRLARYVAAEPKVYEAVVRFGAETTTDDIVGEPTREAPPPPAAALAPAIARLTGELDQLPPAFSAKKVEGERAYRAARAGRPVELRPARVVVHEWRIHAFDGERLRATIRCGGGTYVRALARDLGRLTGSAAHLESLRRTAVGPFDVRDAVPLAELADRAGAALLPTLRGLPDVPQQRLDEDARRRVTSGNAIAAETLEGERAALVDADGSLVALAERRGDRWQPRVVLRDG